MTCPRCKGLLVVVVACGCGGYSGECECGGDGVVERECPACMARPAGVPEELGGELAGAIEAEGGDDDDDCF